MNENTTLRWHMPGDARGGWKGEGKKKARGQTKIKRNQKRGKSRARKEQGKTKRKKEGEQRIHAKGKRKRKVGGRSRAPGCLWEMGRVTAGRGGRPRMNVNTKMAHAR